MVDDDVETAGAITDRLAVDKLVLDGLTVDRLAIDGCDMVVEETAAVWLAALDPIGTAIPSLAAPS